MSYWKEVLVYVPFNYVLSNPPEEFNVINPSIDYPKGNFSFSGKLTRTQQEDLPRIIECLENTKSVILSPFCGYGKTVISVYLLSIIGLKTIILCHRLCIIDQWVQSFKRFSPCRREHWYSLQKINPFLQTLMSVYST